MRSSPTWYPKVVAALVAGKTQLATAKEIGVTPKTLRRHLDAPSGLLKAQIEKARVAQAETAQDEFGPLRGKALAVLEKALDSGDVGAAKTLLSKLVASPADAPPQESQPEPEISPEEAAKEIAVALPAAADLARTGLLSPEVVELLRNAARALLADDLQARAPIDVEAERVEVAAPESPEQPSSGGSAAVIPIRQ
jgi:predicted transcriptional regulator